MSLSCHESLRLYISKSAYLFEPAYVDPSMQTENLVIDRESGFIRRNVPALPAVAQESIMNIYGIFGILRVFSGDVVIVITGRQKIGSLDGHDIFKATDFKLLPFAQGKLHLSDRQSKDEEHFLDSVLHILQTDNFYICYGWDLTRCQQRQIVQPLPLWQRADPRFYFNRALQRRMIELTMSDVDQNLSSFILPVISGFVEIKDLAYGQQRFQYALISRRSGLRTGTRYFSRGIDSDGNVSNFVETEQIVTVRDQIYSHVQLRGSIPLFWKQIVNVQYKPDLIVHSTPATIDAFKRHFEDLRANYGQVICFNLIDRKGYELDIGRTFSDLVRNFGDIKYKHFDFHHECRKMQWHRISALLTEYENDINNQGYFFRDSNGVQQLQTSIIRSNCMDCLDRTNVVQSELARLILTRQLRQAGVFQPNLFVQEVTDIDKAFKNIWADNADAISLMYSGTGALKTDFTRTGKRTKNGTLQDGFYSAIRYLRNNFFDGMRQDAYDLITGKYELSAARNVSMPERSVRFYGILIFLGLAALMLMYTLLIDIPYGNGSFMTLLFWTIIVGVAFSLILENGTEFVDLPRLVNPYQDILMQKYVNDKLAKTKKPAQL